MLIDFNLFTTIAVAVVFSFAIPLFPPLQDSRYLAALSLTAAAVCYGWAFSGFVLVSSIAFLAVRWCSRREGASRRWSAACLAIFTLAAMFTAGRVLHWERPLTLAPSLSVVLYSLEMWAALRLVTLFWEVGSGAVTMPSLNGYITWVCLPFTLGGPLLRFSQMPVAPGYDRKLWRSSAWWLEMLAAAAKLAAGLMLGVMQSMISAHWSQATWNKALLTFVSGPIGFYLSAAGFFHLMEVLGRPAGFQLPSSFNYPLGRENIAEFWMNWNMSVTSIFRDYLFYNRWGRQTYNLYLNTIVLFTLVGLWHAANAYWILWGFLHGLLFCTFLFWRKHKNMMPEIPLRGSGVSGLAARVFTYACVCMCWYLPSKILQKIGGVV